MRISIDANIGAGKTTLLTRLSKELASVPVFLEPIEEWKEWLELFYNDPARWGFTFNTQVLTSFGKMRANDTAKVSLYERSPIANRFVFTQLQFENKHMTNLELRLFNELFSQQAWVPDVIIYIQTDPDVCMERIKKRGRKCEVGVQREYIHAVHEKYEAMLITETSGADLHNTRIIVVDGNRTVEEVYADVLQKILSMLFVRSR